MRKIHFGYCKQDVVYQLSNLDNIAKEANMYY